MPASCSERRCVKSRSMGEAGDGVAGEGGKDGDEGDEDGGK